MSEQKRRLYLDGVLWKWTNYVSGWQPRWFVLDQDVLTYYCSHDDIKNGCRGSVKMPACDVIVHPRDEKRLDLVVPGEQRYCLRAPSSRERQRWLVALGTAKSCVDQQETLSSSEAAFFANELRHKRSELRIYADLLIDQAQNIRQHAVGLKEILPVSEPSTTANADDQSTAATLNVDQNISHSMTSDLNHSAEQLSQMVNIMSTTLDTFTQTLDDVVRISGLNVSSAAATAAPPNVATSSSVSPLPLLYDNSQQRRPSWSRHHSGRSNRTHSTNDSDQYVETFFSEMSVSFVDLNLGDETLDSTLNSDLGDIPLLTDPFLEACRNIVPVFDKMNPTAFSPAKLDFDGNIRKLYQKFLSDPDELNTIQKMLKTEKLAGQSQLTDSATQALLWLRRSLCFLATFLERFGDGETDLVDAASVAYAKSLRPFHVWVLRSVFSVGVRGMPTRENFILEMTPANSRVQPDVFEPVLIKHVKRYVAAVHRIIRIIGQFYRKEHLVGEDQL